MTRYFDTHTHIQGFEYDVDRPEVLSRMRAAGVSMLNVGTDIESSRQSIELAEKEADIWATVGLHPTDTNESFVAEEYRKLASHKKVVAIGECGLDYYRIEQMANREEQIEKQKKVFVEQIKLSVEIKKPLMIHCRDAFPDLISILSHWRYALSDSPGIVHFFSGTAEDAQKLMELGFSFTFGGVITFPPRAGKAAGDYDEIIKHIPLDRILSETDAPYVAPAPYRGKRNEPVYVVEVVKKLAEIKNVSTEEMADKIFENAQKIFRLN